MPADSWSAINAVDDDFLEMVLITCGFVLFLVGAAFKSIFVPVRSVFTICASLLWVYGAEVLVYDKGGLNWLGFSGLSGGASGSNFSTMWFCPIISFSIVVGISLDYDCFLITRITEFRRAGYATVDAIVMGLACTGSIITTAGIIMAVAFGGLLFSSESCVNQLAFYLVFATLFDTFVVRTFLVPALMSLAGELCWWPQRMPPVSKASLLSVR